MPDYETMSCEELLPLYDAATDNEQKRRIFAVMAAKACALTAPVEP